MKNGQKNNVVLDLLLLAMEYSGLNSQDILTRYCDYLCDIGCLTKNEASMLMITFLKSHQKALLTTMAGWLNEEQK